MKIQVLKNIFEQNDNAARENRETLDAQAVTCVNLLGGAGAGKTALLEAVIPTLSDSVRIAVLEGDLATTKDAARIDALGVPVIQLLTEGGCHLNATLVQQGLQRLPLDQLDLLIIENVGNPICPASFDLGEHRRISVLSVTEGDDKPTKYPLMFKTADLIVLTKCDLQPLTDFDIEKATRSLRGVNSQAEILQTQARKGIGIEPLTKWLQSRGSQ